MPTVDSANAGRDAALAQILNHARAAELFAGEPRRREAFGELAVVEIAQFFESRQGVFYIFRVQARAGGASGAIHPRSARGPPKLLVRTPTALGVEPFGGCVLS